MKISKREFVKGATAVALTAAAARSTVGPGAAQAPGAPRKSAGAAASVHLSFDVVVYNNWFPQAREFAATFPAARVLAVGADAGQLWYGTLRGLITSGAVRRIAGCTSHADLLILETLARESGLKVRSRSESGRYVSWVLI